MRIIETKVYTYSELSDKAKERARDWYREGSEFFSDFVTDDAETVLSALGWTLGTLGRRNKGIWFTGFWSQGDGACFEGKWYAAHVDETRMFALLADRPMLYMRAGKEIRNAGNAAIHEYAAHVRECVKAGLQFVSCEHRNRYCHEYSVSFTEHEWSEDGTPADATAVQLSAIEQKFDDASRAYMREIYRALEAEYTYQHSDEQVAESIEANEYEFTEDGKRA